MKTDMKLADIAEKMFLFKDIVIDDLERELHFLEYCAARTFETGEILQSAAAPLGGLAYIYRGTATVLSDGSDKAVLLRSLSCGDVIGASTLYSANRGYSTVIRADKACSVFVIPEEQIKRIISTSSVAAENYIRYLTDKICFLNRKITAFTAGSAEAKLAVYLLGLPRDSDGTVSLPCSLSALADMLNMGRASLYRSLDSMTENGILARERKKITLLNVDALHNIF